VAKVYLTQAGDRCDSDYERAIIDDLIDRGVSYEYETARLDYTTPVTNGRCEACGEQSKRVVQRRYRTLDITLGNGIIVEVKGKFQPSIRGFMRELIKQHQDRDIRFMFMTDGWQTKAHKRTYMDWARAQGIQAAVGDPRQESHLKAYGCGGIPQEWIDE
jgi:hypothetical protein